MEKKPTIRYLDYLTALETLNAHRVNPAPPFGLMLAFAFSLHVAMMLAWTWFGGGEQLPQERVLQLRLGGAPELGAGPAVNGGGRADTKDVPPEDKAQNVLERALVEKVAPARPAKPRPAREVASSYREPTEPVAPSAEPATSPTASAPLRGASRPGVEGTGGRGVAGGSAYGNSTSTQAEAISRYEQELSGWLERHKVYPKEALAEGLEGRVVVRVQMNRQGKVLGHWIERSSGHKILDQAVLAQVRRADPFPPAPPTYPGRSMLEFRFPVTLYLR
jgi:protein TonB